jgi:hypothetical protein
MPKISADTKRYYRERVRSIMVQEPMLSGEGIRRRLEQQGLVLDRNYINSLVNQIHRERAKRADTWTLKGALTALQDAMGEVVRVGWEIANDKFAEGRDRAVALREIREAYNLVFEKMFDAGVFERKLGTLDASAAFWRKHPAFCDTKVGGATIRIEAGTRLAARREYASLWQSPASGE